MPADLYNHLHVCNRQFYGRACRFLHTPALIYIQRDIKEPGIFIPALMESSTVFSVRLFLHQHEGVGEPVANRVRSVEGQLLAVLVDPAVALEEGVLVAPDHRG
jgi:hypothetical protein